MRAAETRRASLLVDSRCVQALNPAEQGSSDGRHTAGSAIRLSRMVRRVLRDGVAAFPRARVRRDRVRRSPHDLSSAADRRGAGRRPLVELSRRALEAALVDVAAGADSRATRRRSFRSARHDLDQRRRHCHAASGEEGLRQGPASRRRPFHALVHSVEVGTRAPAEGWSGRAGDRGATAGLEPPLGAAGVVRAVPDSRRGQEARTPSQDAVRPDAAASVRAAALVCPAEIRVRRGRGLWNARPRAVRFPSAAADADQQVLQGREPPRPASEAEAGDEWPAARQRTQASRSGSGRREDAKPTAARGLMVWRRPPS